MKLYFHQAEKYGPLLNLKVAKKKTAKGPVPMAGFPFFQLDRFLKILVQDFNEYVAISEEFANDAAGSVKSGGLLFNRKVTRTITPGTLIDEKFMDPYENNFLLAIHAPHTDGLKEDAESESVPVEFVQGHLASARASDPVGLAWLDLSTGDFFLQSTKLGSLATAVARIGAKEVVLCGEVERNDQEKVLSSLQSQRHSLTYHAAELSDASTFDWGPMLEREVDSATQASLTSQEIAAGSLLLSYVGNRLQNSSIKLQSPVRKQERETMSIDQNSMRALEVLATSKEGLGAGKGSLLHTIRRTVTKSGTRLLRDWIASPSMSLEVINGRLDLVSELMNDKSFKEEIVRLLKRSFDSQRLVQKFSMGRGDEDDLVSLLRTIEATNEIATSLEDHTSSLRDKGSNAVTQQDPLQMLSARLSLEGPNRLAATISASIDEDGLMESHRAEDAGGAELLTMAQEVLQTEGSADDHAALSRVTRAKSKQKAPGDQEAEVVEGETWILRKNASAILETLHKALNVLRQQKAELVNNLRSELEAPSLTLRLTPGMGYICHVKGVKDVAASMKSSSGREVRTTKSTRSFHHGQWSSLGSKIDQAKLRIKAEEQRVLKEIRGQVVLNLVKLRRNATVLDELDIGCSFATLAEEQGFVRPTLNSGLEHRIISGRHPTVMQGLEEQGRTFVSNDCLIGGQERIWLITGPNMAGKSTFLRQNALISILAQIGCFVPAKSAEIGLVDQIFTRVGSADNLFRDQSTFMVEMMETAAILNQATPQSFVIMDEIGRGTTPEDGIAVGFACLHHLYFKNRCRTLFATHFHSLADMTKELEHLACYCTDIDDGPGDSFSFVHRLRKGVNRSSHALKVARLAGIPEVAIETAKTVLKEFESEGSPLSKNPLYQQPLQDSVQAG